MLDQESDTEARVRAHGSVVVQGGHGGRGRIVELWPAGLRFTPVAGARRFEVAASIELDLRLDGKAGGWERFSGRVERIEDDGTIAIELAGAPPGFEEVLREERIAELARATTPHLLVVDPMPMRRASIVERLREAGCHVSEAATPLDAIVHLGESRTRPRLALIAETYPADNSDELHAFMTAAHVAVRRYS
jgi:hypothetical protein